MRLPVQVDVGETSPHSDIWRDVGIVNFHYIYQCHALLSPFRSQEYLVSVDDDDDDDLNMPTLEVMEATMSGLVISRFPSVSSLLLSLVASVTLLVLIRLAFTRFVTVSLVTSSADADEKGATVHRSPSNGAPLDRSWNWSWQWERINLSLPVSFSMSGKDYPGIGGGTGVAVTLQKQERHQHQHQQPTAKARWQTHRRNVGFEPPCKLLVVPP